MLKAVNDTTAYDVGFRFAALSKTGKVIGYYPDKRAAAKYAPSARIVAIVNRPDRNHIKLQKAVSASRQGNSTRGRFKPQFLGGSKVAMIRNPINTFDANRSNAGSSDEDLKKNRIILAPEGYTAPKSTRDKVLESLSPGMRAFKGKGAPFLPETMWPVPKVNIPAPRGLGYLPHQVAAIVAMARRQNVLLADQQGLGKTMEILGYMNLMQPDKTLIVCPKKMVATWIRESEKWLVKKPVVVVVKGTPKDRRLYLPEMDSGREITYNQIKSLPKEYDIIICNYHTFTQKGAPIIVIGPDGEPIELKKAVRQEVKNFVAEITKKSIDLCVLDECHSLSNVETVMAKAFFGEKADPEIPGTGFSGILNLVTNKIFATGTPLIGGKPITMYHFLHSLSKKDFTSEYAFSDYFGSTRGRKSNKEKEEGKDGPLRNLDVLSVKLRDSVMIRRLAEDVLDLPFEIRSNIEAINTPEIEAAFHLQSKALADAGVSIDSIAAIIEAMDTTEEDAEVNLNDISDAISSGDLSADEQAALIEGLDKKFESEAIKIAESYGVRNRYFLQEITKARVAMAKARALQFDHMLSEIERKTEGQTNGKIVVFFHHKAVLNFALAALERRGYGKDQYVVVDGGTADEDADKKVNDFVNNKDVKFFFGSIKTCGAGITLTAANVILFLEQDWTPANNLQAEKRIHRIGQKAEFCYYFYSIKTGSIDANVVRIIAEKVQVQKKVLDKFPTEEAIDKYDKKFKDMEIPGAQFQIAERYAIRNALLDALDELAEPQLDKKGKDKPRFEKRSRYDYINGVEEEVKDYYSCYSNERLGRAKISINDYNQMAEAAAELQITGKIRTQALDEAIIHEVLPLLWKVRTFIKKRGVLANINFPESITGRTAGLFSPTRGLDTRNFEHFALLNFAVFDERVAERDIELREKADRRKKKKASELEDIGAAILGSFGGDDDENDEEGREDDYE